jgi:hypothetical protein
MVKTNDRSAHPRALGAGDPSLAKQELAEPVRAQAKALKGLIKKMLQEKEKMPLSKHR